MVSERGLRYSQYTATLHSWLPAEVEIGNTAGVDRHRALLSYFEPESTGARRIRKIVLEAMQFDANACQNLFDARTREKMASESLDAQRWRVICLRLAALLPADNLVAPEAQLTQMELWPDKEDLLGFCERYRQSAESFIAEGRVSKDRAVQILFNKVPLKVKDDIIAGMGMADATLTRIEEAVRQRVEWYTVATPGTIPIQDVAQCIPSMQPQHLQALASNPSVPTFDDGMDLEDQFSCYAIPGLIKPDGSVDLTKIKTMSHVMIVWKRLMAIPRFRREANRFLSRTPDRKDPRLPASQLNLLDEKPELDDEDLWTHQSGDTAHLQIMSEAPIVCAQVGPSRKPSVQVRVVLNGRRFSALVDTGATTSFIQVKTLRAAQLDHLMQPCSMHVALCNGETMPLLGRLSLDMTIYDDQYTVDTYVLQGKGPPIILGFAFLEEADLLVSCREKKLMKADGRSIQCYMGQVQSADLQVEQLKEQVSILEESLMALQKNGPSAPTKPASQC